MKLMNDSEGEITIIIFGASGDLARRKLIPALYNNYCKGRLPGELNLIGTSRSVFSHEEFRTRLREGIETLTNIHCEDLAWGEFSKRIWYLPGDGSNEQDYVELDAFVSRLEGDGASRMYYLATAPSLFPMIIEKLGSMGMAKSETGWRRIVVEKPFGNDLGSAIELNKHLHRFFQEDQIYRIDHYLGKDTAQNILYFRFLNSIFEPIWNRNHVDNVQISVLEQVDVEHRAAYYDHSGVLRDMFQNHLLQLLTLVAMEPPATFEADAVRNEKVKVLSAIEPPAFDSGIGAQYEGYTEIEGVQQNSRTPTFAAVKLYIDNWRWQNVPFYLRSGKALDQKTSEIMIEFLPPPHVLFDLPEGYQLIPNLLSLCIQPDEGIHLRFETKVPDSTTETRSVDMDFHYRTSFAGENLPDAYERLLLDAMNGDASLFTRSDEIEMAWKIFDPLIQAWEQDPTRPLATYSQGSEGPIEADSYLESEGRVWRWGCMEH